VRWRSVAETSRKGFLAVPAAELFVAAVSIRRLAMRRALLVTLLAGSAIAASAALFACGNGDDNGSPVPPASVPDASLDGTAGDGGKGDGGSMAAPDAAAGDAGAGDAGDSAS
jgi:hypothetical protein